ncbi:hypothetical protein ROA7450_03352 [Roseovarius albus]|uniref:Uncharacterized protein n=1 Tax=Roseovarius albus TaxID=1247867 RepID=A0A1X6ZWL8_9RHOB|nr:hypothetical protein [Roseovarius albus]SLN63819.1 hypothetical protein ROA7450_03352 [Roseovarius albus]
MPNRARSPLKKNAESKFPVRVRIKTPELGYGRKLDEMFDWLNCEVGQNNYVWVSDRQPGHDASAVYLRSLDDAQKLVECFELELLFLEELKLV